ncbi:MAG: DUF2927 domain-containing protein [Paracoccaceae bacterium]
MRTDRNNGAAFRGGRKVWRGLVGSVVLAVLSACVPPEPQAGRRLDPDAPIALPPARAFGAAAVMVPTRSNAEMARDFLDLSFRMESGREVAKLTRFGGPVEVRLTGPVPPFAEADLNRLITRLRAEAGIDIGPAGTGRGAEITVQFLPRRTIQALVPAAACFVAPNVSSWDEYRRARGSARTDWTALTVRERVAVFIPADVAPQEVRDCLNEEIAQGLGPLNDLYRLPDSVFNDDNVQGLLTGFDMLMLRVHYSPRLWNGMSEAEAAAVVPAVLAAVNPRGGPAGLAAASDDTPRAYVSAIETALGPRASPEARRGAAGRAIGIAEERGWRDARAGFAWFVLGRLSLSGRPDQALEAFGRAEAIYRGRPGMALQAANVGMQFAAFALSQGDAEAAIARADAAAGPAAAAQNAALLATLLLIKAEALDIGGREGEAASVRAEGLGWARYGFGSGAEVARRATEIAALSPARRAASVRRLMQ